MADWKYLMGLVIIVSVVWIMMIICLAIVYLLLSPLEELTLDRLATNVIQLIVAGFIVLAWLYSWNMLVKFHFHRNLRAVTTKPLNVATKEKEHRKRLN